MHLLIQIQCFVQLRRNNNGETSEPVPFEYFPISLGRRSERHFDFLADILVKRSSSESSNSVEAGAMKVAHLPPVIDLVSPDDEPITEANLGDSDAESSAWMSSCSEGSPSERRNHFDEAAGLNELLEQVADMDEIYVADQQYLQRQISTDSWFQPNHMEAFVMCASGDGIHGEAFRYGELGGTFSTGFPGPINQLQTDGSHDEDML